MHICDLGVVTGAGVKMEHFQAVLDPRKQELLEARFLGARVSALFLFPVIFFILFSCFIILSDIQ